MLSKNVKFSLCLLLSFILISSSAFNFSSAQTIDGEEDQYLTYEHLVSGFNIQYPSEWVAVEPPDPLIKLVISSPLENESDQFQEYTSVMLEKFKGEMKPRDYADLTIQDLKSKYFPDFTLQQLITTFLDDKPAYKIKFSFKDKDMELTQIRYIISVDETIFVVLFTSKSSIFSTYESIFEKMKDSFEIREGTPPVIIGTYVDEDSGVEIDFPEDWIGLEIKQEDPTVVSSPTSPPGLSDSVNMGLVILENEDLNYEPFSLFTHLGKLCKFPKIMTIVDLNGKKAGKSEFECQDAYTNDPIQIIGYLFSNYKNTIFIYLSSDSKSTLESNLPLLKKTLSTLKFASTIDFSNLSKMAEAFELRETKKEILIYEKNIDVEIISQSQIVGFSHTKDPYSISFNSRGGAGYNQEFVQIDVTEILRPPFTVSKEGVDTEEFYVIKDETTGFTSLTVYLEQGRDNIKIVGFSPKKSDLFESVAPETSTEPVATKDQDTESTLSPNSILKTESKNPKTMIPGFPDLNKSPNHYFERYEKESEYKDWFDSEFPDLSIQEVVGYKSTQVSGFPDPSKSPQSYIDRYSTEPAYKDWFDSEFPDKTLYKVLGFSEPKKIPEWIKNNAAWWADGQIDDSSFVQGIQYLIKEGIMKIPETIKSETTSESQEIPGWIKNNAEWWAKGLISEDDFVNGIKYLVEKGIIVV